MAFDSESGGSLGLNALVSQLRSELEKIEREKQSSDNFFSLHNFDLEVQFVVKRNRKESGKLEAEVVTAEMEQELGTERTNKVTLHLELTPKEPIAPSKSDPSLDIKGATPVD